MILIVVLAVSVFALYEAIKVPDEIPTQTSTAPQPVRAVPAETTWPAVSNASSAVTATAPTSRSAALQEQLAMARERLDQRAQRLANLQAQQTQWMQQLNVVNPNLMSERATQIQNLSDLLTTQRLAEGDINRSVADNLNLQSSNEQYARDQLDLNIQQVTESIQQMHQQASLPPPAGFITGEQKQDYYAGLQNGMTLLYTQLNDLRNQRVQLSANHAAQIGQLQADAQDQKTEVLENQADLQQQIFSVRDEIRNVQNSNNEIRMSLVPLSQQIEQAKQNYQSVQTEISGLESSAQSAAR